MRFLIPILMFFFAASALGAEKDWTVLVWLNADNNLCSYAQQNINQMQSSDASANANWLVAFDCSKANDSKLVSYEGKNEIILDSGKEYDMGDWQFLSKTAKDVFERFPSKHRMIVMWNHGSGWKNSLVEDTTRGISYDDQSGNHITTAQMAQVVDQIGMKLDILAYDACLMQMAETAYEVGSKLVDYQVASEESEPGDGWDYTKLMALLVSPNASAIDVSKAIVDGFMAHYPTNKSVTQSVVDMAAMESFVKDFGLWYSMIDKTKIAAAMKTATAYADRDFKDIGSFLKNYGNTQDILASYNKAIVYNAGRGTGASIYYSTYPRSDYYQLKFFKDTNWLK